MTRRVWCLSAVALPAFRAHAADPAADAWDVIASAARALTAASASEFLGYCDHSMPGYETFRGYVTALLTEAEVQSSIEPVRNDGDEHTRVIELDWLLRITPRGTVGSQTERHRNVICRVDRRGNKWRMAGFEPLAFLAPPSPA